ncbi:unnamed protein product [Symbiodinium sp. CCMP2592]|nr:unnamed protein product [Symbiodinium sp. CCMP2592]
MQQNITPSVPFPSLTHLLRMPRPPKKCGQKPVTKAGGKASKGGQKEKGKTCKEADGSDESAGTRKLIQEVTKACATWVSEKSPHARLPMAAIQQLSHVAWEVKMDSWRCREALISDTAKDLVHVADSGDVLSRVFKALQSKCMTPGDLGRCRPESSEAKLENDAAGLSLAFLILDLSAANQPSRDGSAADNGVPNFQPGEEVIAHSVSFLWHEVRFTLPMLLEATAATTEAAAMCTKVTRALRSIHHLFASRRYASRALPATCLAHRTAVLASQCSSIASSLSSCTPAIIKTALAALGEASSDLLVALLGYGCTDAALQSAAFAELGKLAASQQMLVNGLSGKGPSFLALALRAIGAMLLPFNLEEGRSGEAQTARRAAECVASAEARAGNLAAAVLQVLVDSHGSDFTQLEGLVMQLVSACADPKWATAPLFALRMIAALRRVAGASRGVDLECGRREEATRLIGKAAEALCSQHLEASTATAAACESDASVLRKATPPASGTECPRSTSSWLALAGFQKCDSGGQESALLSPASGASSQGLLQGSAVPANCAACNAAALLCLATGSSPGKGKKAKATKTSQADGSLPILRAWASCSSLESGGAEKASVQAGRSARRLYSHLLWRDGESYLSRARTAALESLLSIARGHPLALVRRQALASLAGACMADPSLLASRCIVEAVASGLQDEAALARLASVDLVLRLSSHGHGEVIEQRLAELRGAVRGRLSDPSPLVRRAAFRAACQWLEEGVGAPSHCLQEAGNLLRRLRSEQPTIRSFVLGVLARVVFNGLSKTGKDRLESLQVLLAQSGAGGTGIRDVIAAHCRAMDASKDAEDAPAATTSVMAEVVSCALAVLPAKPEKLEKHQLQLLTILEQVGMERPAAFQSSLALLQRWLDVDTPCQDADAGPSKSAELDLPICACNILAQVLPHWAEHTSTLSKQSQARKLMAQLSALMEEARVPLGDLGLLARAVVRCLSVLVPLWPPAGQMLVGHFGRSVRILAEVVQQSGPVPHGRICRHAWIVGSVVEFLDQGCELLSTEGGCKLAFESAVLLLSDCCLRGPLAGQPAIVTALGFALRRCPSLLREEARRSAGGPGPLEVLRHGLQQAEGNGANLRARTAETFAGLAAHFQEVAQANSASSSDMDAVSEASIAAQSLAGLQKEVMQILHSTDSISTLQALRGLNSLCDLGVVHPASTLPSLISASLAGNPSAAPHTRGLLLRLVEATPPLLVQKCGHGLRAAAEQLALQLGPLGSSKGSIHQDAWRFASVCDAYGTFLSDGKQMRDQFLTALMTEMISTGIDAGDLSQSQVLLRVQLALGLLMRLPISREAELARIFECTIQFLMLKVMPFLADVAAEPEEGQAGKEDSLGPSFALVAVAIVLHKLSMHWLSLVGSEFAKQMQAFAACPNSDRPSATLDLPLPPGFARKEPPDFSETFQQLKDSAGDGNLSVLLSLEIPADSPLLAGKVTKATGVACAARSRRGRKRGGDAAEGAEGAEALQEAERADDNGSSKRRRRPKRALEGASKKADADSEAKKSKGK